MTATGFFVRWGVVGLFLWMGFHGTLVYLPHTVTFNWVNQTVTSSALFRTWALPFHEIGGIILPKKVGMSGTISVVPTPPCYGVQLKIAKKGMRNPPSSFVLLESESYVEPDFSLGLERWACLLQALSDSLNIPGQVLSKDGKILQAMNQKDSEVTDGRK